MAKRNYAFVDGSYNPKTKEYGAGGFLVDQNAKTHFFKIKDTKYASMRNVAGEILGVLQVLAMASQLNMKELTIYHDYEGIGRWTDGSWKASKEYTKYYVDCVLKTAEYMTLVFKHVRGHSGNKGNETADRLAKEAVGLR